MNMKEALRLVFSPALRIQYTAWEQYSRDQQIARNTVSNPAPVETVRIEVSEDLNSAWSSFSGGAR